MKGQNVLITGGTGGLGMGVTQVILDRGADVTIPYINDREVDRHRTVRLRCVAGAPQPKDDSGL